MIRLALEKPSFACGCFPLTALVFCLWPVLVTAAAATAVAGAAVFGAYVPSMELELSLYRYCLQTKLIFIVNQPSVHYSQRFVHTPAF